MSDYNCRDCGVDTHDLAEYYMVTTRIWAEAGMAKHGGMLCIACLERRLGRLLTGVDFTNCPINRLMIFAKSPRLLSRMLS